MPRAGLTAERLTLAAADLADEAGFEAVTVAALARRFAVKDASLYSHVPNLAALRDGITVLALTELADALAAATAGRAGGDALAGWADTYRRWARAHPGRWVALQRPLTGPPHPAAARHGQLVRAVLRGYGLTGARETDAGRYVVATVYGFIGLEAAGGYAADPRRADASWVAAVDALDRALVSWPRAAPTPRGSSRRDRGRP